MSVAKPQAGIITAWDGIPLNHRGRVDRSKLGAFQMTAPRKLLAITAALMVSGCAAPPPARPVASIGTPFVAAEHDLFKATGVHTLQGQAFLRQRGGSVVTCAGARVSLWPATTYFKEIYRTVRSGAQVSNLTALPESHREIVRTAVCDAHGAFRFDGLPAASWIAITTVVWSAGNHKQGGTLSRVVESGATQPSVILTERDFVGR